MRTNFSLSAKISIIIIIAVMIPLVVLSGLTIRTIRSIALGNLESFVLENGSRRQAAIESDLRDSLNVLNEFLKKRPNSKFYNSAEDLMYTVAFTKAKESNSVEKYKDYIKRTSGRCV